MDYFKVLSSLFLNIEVSDNKGKVTTLNKAISKIINLIIARGKKGNKVIFIGNGGSASIASHLSTDFLKNAKIAAMAFNDPSLLTCISNDFGYEYVFEKPIEIFADNGDVLFAISSSGKSENIIRGVRMARLKKCYIITLSAFKKDNSLRALGDLNFYVPSSSYGFVEVAHHSLCHNIVDSIVRKKSRSKMTWKKVDE